MGIKFFCPNGHKLHVKSFLGGKLGICPHCGQKVRIPAETEQTEPSLPAQRVTEVQSPGSHSTLQSSVTENAIKLEPDLTSKILGTNFPSADEQDATSVGTTDTPHLLSDRPETVDVASDPLDEHPGAVWYVRPVSGGQFGPADARVMREWLAEGRVGPEALVWRQGWKDWKKAVLLFPAIGRDISPENPSSPLHLSETPWVTPGKVSEKFDNSPIITARREISRVERRSTRSMTIVIILLLIILALLPVLGLVMFHRFNSDPQVKQVQRCGQVLSGVNFSCSLSWEQFSMSPLTRQERPAKNWSPSVWLTTVFK